MIRKNTNALPSYNNFYFISDLDRTLIYSKRAIQESDPKYCKNIIPIEYKDGKVISYMNKNAYGKLQKLITHENFKFTPCTMRTLQQLQRISFFKDTEYFFADGGINLYKKETPCFSYGKELLSIFHRYSYNDGYSWAQEIEEVYYDLRNKLNIAEQETNKHFILPDTQLETLTFFDLHCSNIIENKNPNELTENDKDILREISDILAPYHVNGHINGRKLYVFPDFLQKDCIFSFVENRLNGVVAGDSAFDVPLLSTGYRMGLEPIVPKHGEIEGNLSITKSSGPAAADDILSFVEQKFYI